MKTRTELFNTCLNRLKRSCPADAPVEIHLVKPSDLEDDKINAYSTAKFKWVKGKRKIIRYRIVIRNNASEHETISFLEHEWAHILEKKCFFSSRWWHGPAWGVAYSKAYRATRLIKG